jgi:autotransporter-associated beta strand protein
MKRRKVVFVAVVLSLAALLAHIAPLAALAATYYWDNNGFTNGFGTAGGTWAPPTTGSSAQGWSTSLGGTLVPGNITTTAADDLNFGLITNGLAAGTITVSGTVTNNTLTFASGSGAITLTGGPIAMGGTSSGITVLNQSDTINSPIRLLANATIKAPDFGTGSTVSTLTLGGAISGSASLTFSSASTVANNSQQTILLNAPSSYTGSTTLDPAGNGANLIVKLGIEDALPPATVLSLNGVAAGGSGRFARLELNGFDQTLGGIQNTPASQRTQQIRNSSATAATLTVNNSASYTFSGRIESNLSLTKGGSGTLTLSGTNSYSGDTTINAGTLTVRGAGRLGGGTYAGNITNNASFDYGSSAAQTLSGVISGSGSLTNSEPGTLTLTGTDTLPRNTVDGGTFVVSGSGSVSGLVSVNAGGSLSLTGGGRVNTVTVNSGGDVSLPANGIATNLTFASTGTMSFDFSTATNVGTLTVTAANGITNNGAAGSITINLTGAVPADGTYTLINYSGSLRGSGFSAYQTATGPVGKSYSLVNAAGAVQLSVTTGAPSVRVETKADGTGIPVPATTLLTGTSLTYYAILRDPNGVFITNTPATWSLTNLTGAVASSNLVAAVGGKSAVFKAAGAGSARIRAGISSTNSVLSGTITTIGLNTRPYIWVRDSDKAGILAKIATNAWATTIYNGMVARVAADLISHQNDRAAFLRGLPANWAAAPPTFNTGGGAANACETYFNTASDCAVLYYLTGDADYARCAADILHNSVQAFQNLAPSTSTGNGGWIIQDDLLYEARQVGCQLPVVYDFLYPYLQANQVYDVGATGMTNFSFADAQYVFRTYYQLVRDHGQKDSNWSALMSTCMLNSLLALDSSSERAAALQIYLVTGSSRQASLDYDYRNYDQPGDIWPESLQYAGGVGSIRSTHMVLLERYDPTLNLFGVYSNLPTSLPRVSYLVYPNTSMQISFGDGHREAQGHPYFRYELMYQHAQARGRTNLTSLFGSLINGGVASGDHNRATLNDYDRLGQHDEPLQLLWWMPTIPEPGVTPALPRTDTLPFAGIALQRNPSTVNNSTYGLMGFVGGAAHVHSHACGMSMELFGLGQVLGAKPGRDDYGSAIHENYYRVFAANNTVVVNAASRGEGGWSGLGINTAQTVAMEPAAFALAVSSNFSFTCSSFADTMGTLAEGTQQRTLAILRTSPTNGFYVDFFRSKSTVTNRVATTLSGNVTNQFHDYIYHNVGSTSVSLTTNDVALPLVSQPSRFQNDIGDGYDQPGWRYFSNTVVSFPHSQSTRAQFVATPSGTALYMDMILPAVTNREYAKVTAPPITDYGSANSAAIVVRQIGDAWDKPFAVVYEPHFGASGGTVDNVTTLLRSSIVVGLKIESIVAGKSMVHHVFSNPNATESYTNAAIGLMFKGRFGVVADSGDGTTTLYLGQGSALAYRGNSVVAVGGANTQAEVRFVPGQPPQITANAAVDVVAASAPQFTLITRQAGGAISLQAIGSNGVPYRLWSNTNLWGGGWTVFSSGTITNRPFVISDTGSVNNPTRFYRFSTP